MKILISVFTAPPQQNGVANVAWHHAVGLSKMGHEVTLATCYNENRGDLAKYLPVQIEEFKICGNSLLGYSGETDRYMAYISEYDGDIICCHAWATWNLDLAADVFQRVTIKAHKVLISHGSIQNCLRLPPRYWHNWLKWRKYLWMKMPKMMKLFDHVVFLSNRIDRDRFYDRMIAERIHYKSYTIIPNGIEMSDTFIAQDDFRKRSSVKRKHMLLCVGNYSKMKNENFVLSAFIKARPDDTELIFIGNQKNAYMEEMKRRWQKHYGTCSGCQVTFLAGLSENEIMSAYKAADIFLYGSRSECFPLVVLQAMAAGIPYISTRVGCVEELRGGNTVNSSTDMAHLITKYLSNEDLRKSTGSDGRNAIQTSFTWPHIVQQYDTLFNQLHDVKSCIE